MASSASILTSSAWLLGAGIALVLVALLVRSWFRRADSASGEAFSLHEIRELHASGHLTDQEFEAMRAMLLTRAQSAEPRRSSPDARSKRADPGASAPPGEAD